MAFNDLEYYAVKKEIEAFIESIRPPEYIRDELDIVFTIDDQSIEIGEKRPALHGAQGEFSILMLAKIDYLRIQNKWELYWMRSREKWELYQIADTLAEALEMVRTDARCCFFA